MRQNTKWKWWQNFRSKDHNNSEVKVSVGCSIWTTCFWLQCSNIQSIYLRQDYELIRNDGNILSCQGEGGGVPMKMLRGIVYWQIMCVYLQCSCTSATLQVNIWSVTFMQQASALLSLLLNTPVDMLPKILQTPAPGLTRHSIYFA